MSYQYVSINDKDFDKKLYDAFVEDGVVVITDVFTKEECYEYATEIISYFEKFKTGVNANDVSTWTDDKLPPQTRPGLFQNLVSNIPIVWNIRSHKMIRKIFESIYSSIRKKKVSDFIVSNDAINVRPEIPPFHDLKNPDKADWPHIDQTMNEAFYCVQGQAVLTNTTAAFRASLKSYKIYEQILKYYKISKNCPTNWLRIQKNDVAYFKKLLAEIGGSWQVPIYSEAGSFIIWSSSTIHSAKLQNKPILSKFFKHKKIPKINKKSTINIDKWDGWRCVPYVCYRPREDFSLEELERRKNIVGNNSTTNHYGTKIFEKKVYKINNPAMLELVKNPEEVYALADGMKPILTDDQLKLCGF
jgi:hypothetical protein